MQLTIAISGIETKVDRLIAAFTPASQIGDTQGGGASLLSYSAMVTTNGCSEGRVVTASDIMAINAEDLQRRSGIVKGLAEYDKYLEYVNEMCRELDPSVTPVNVFGMGLHRKRTTEYPNPGSRLHKIHFASFSCLRSMMSQASRLRNIARWKHAYLRRSMSDSERQELTKLAVRPTR